MLLVKLLQAPFKLFKKDVITFVIIRRYDLGILDDRLRYISVKPDASISVLRQKIWHILGLPDFCEEVIVLKDGNDKIVPLYDLRKGNDPQRPYILEVYLPRNRYQTLSSRTTVNKNNMLTIENGDEQQQCITYDDKNTVNDAENCQKYPEFTEPKCPVNCFSTTISNDTIFNKPYIEEDRKPNNIMDFKHELSYPVSSCSLFKKNKGVENLTPIFLKIQSDLSSLSVKLSNLEKKVTT